MLWIYLCFESNFVLYLTRLIIFLTTCTNKYLLSSDDKGLAGYMLKTIAIIFEFITDK